MFTFLKKLLEGNKEPKISIPDPDYHTLINHIKKRETVDEIPPGKKIHSFDYDPFEIRLDRDITNNYRITVFQATERIFSFTVFLTKDDIHKLEEAYKHVITFLKGNQSIANLPDNELIKGFYFGSENR